MMEIENEKRLWDGEFKGVRLHQRQRMIQVSKKLLELEKIFSRSRMGNFFVELSKQLV